MHKLIYSINGPNLNLIGSREPEIYGTASLVDAEAECRSVTEKFGFDLYFFQSNHEGQMIDKIQEAREKGAAAILINPAAYGHTSIALLDAVKCFAGLVAEVHFSNIYQRESFRHSSYISLRADCVIVGCGVAGYRMATQFLVEKLSTYQ